MIPSPTEETTRYAGLCAVGVHLLPESPPQAHNAMGIPLGSVRPDGGLVTALHERSGTPGVCAAGCLPLLVLGARKDRRKRASIMCRHREAKREAVPSPKTAPNHRLQATPHSLRSSLAPATGR